MNIAIIFAGGSGVRMRSASKPKQFLELNGKPIIIYTLEHFDRHEDIDAIVVVCIESWIDYLKDLTDTFKIKKVVSIVPGGQTGQQSIRNGIFEAERLFPHDSLVLIHDGVRPLIDRDTISENIREASQKGNCITCIKSIETLVVEKEDGSKDIPTRDRSFLARAPQTFVLKDIAEAHRRAIADNRHDFIDSCTLMDHYGHRLHSIIGPMENIKITTPMDYFVFKAIVQARENEQIFGF